VVREGSGLVGAELEALKQQLGVITGQLAGMALQNEARTQSDQGNPAVSTVSGNPQDDSGSYVSAKSVAVAHPDLITANSMHLFKVVLAVCLLVAAYSMGARGSLRVDPGLPGSTLAPGANPRPDILQTLETPSRQRYTPAYVASADVELTNSFQMQEFPTSTTTTRVERLQSLQPHSRQDSNTASTDGSSNGAVATIPLQRQDVVEAAEKRARARALELAVQEHDKQAARKAIQSAAERVGSSESKQILASPAEEVVPEPVVAQRLEALKKHVQSLEQNGYHVLFRPPDVTTDGIGPTGVTSTDFSNSFSTS
jgi:hypothetical protein